MMLKIASKPRVETGKYVIKSIITWWNGALGFSTGSRKPCGFCVLCLLAWHTGQRLTNYLTLSCMFYQKNLRYATANNFLKPKWPPKALLCKSESTTCTVLLYASGSTGQKWSFTNLHNSPFLYTKSLPCLLANYLIPSNHLLPHYYYSCFNMSKKLSFSYIVITLANCAATPASSAVSSTC